MSAADRGPGPQESGGVPERLAVVMVGRTPALFDALFDKLEGAVSGAIEAATVRAPDSETRAILGEVRRAGQAYVEAKLNKPSLENDRLLSEIAATYAEAERRLAEREKLVEESQALRIENARAQLRLVLETLALRACLATDGEGNMVLDLARARELVGPHP